MSTYGDKVRKYHIKVKVYVDNDQDPPEHDLKKLAYYMYRAEKKGWDHETKAKDKIHWMNVKVQSSAKKFGKELLRQLLP